MRRLRLAVPFLVAVVVLCLCTGSALANSTVNMQLTSVGGNNAGGVYTYPYYFSINGAAPVALICDSYDNEVIVGETWTATVSSLLSGHAGAAASHGRLRADGTWGRRRSQPDPAGSADRAVFRHERACPADDRIAVLRRRPVVRPGDLCAVEERAGSSHHARSFRPDL